MTETRITIARGDGIGPEIMDATLRILDAAGAKLSYDEIVIGEQQYKAGETSGISADAWDIIRRNGAMLKAPITTPQGGGYKSLNVTIRKSLNLYANVRPTRTYTPYVPSTQPEMDLVIVRENEEDLYAGIEHRQTNEVTQVLKLITKPGSERIIRYAFEYARAYGRQKVTCMSKDNIMKLADGLFHKTFDEIATEYPDIEADHQIIDIGSAQIAANPDRFDVIVTLNLYGDIISDIASQVAGSVGLAGSANVGDNIAMFEAIHGSAPDIAGQGIANPSGLLQGAIQMLVHVGQADVAATIQNAWLTTLESGVHTGDVYQEGLSTQRVGTEGFADAVIAQLGETPTTLKRTQYQAGTISVGVPKPVKQVKELRGVDIFLDWDEDERDPDVLGQSLIDAAPEGWRLALITNRGVKVFPDGMPETFKSDHWRCRFLRTDGGATEYGTVLDLMTSLTNVGHDIIKTENLCAFDGERGWSLGQGE